MGATSEFRSVLDDRTKNPQVSQIQRVWNGGRWTAVVAGEGADKLVGVLPQLEQSCARGNGATLPRCAPPAVPLCNNAVTPRTYAIPTPL